MTRMFRRMINFKNYTFKEIILLAFILVFLKTLVFIYLSDARAYEYDGIYKEMPLNLKYVIVHLDLKGAPPKLVYLKRILPTLKKYGANGLLIEYEDMFPYEDELKDLRSVNCYGRQELGDFLSTASKEGFEVIPLIQTFGHMEYVLKLNKYVDLWEHSLHPDSICPSKAKSLELIKSMLYQVLDFHMQYSNVKHIHIGCDEVYRINLCEDCLGKKLSKDLIYLNHVKNISTTITGRYPTVTVLIWDDMLRHIDYETVRTFNLSDYIEPVYWDYTAKVARVYTTLHKYRRLFNDSIWLASAFKGADGVTAVLPYLPDRFRNHYAWMKIIKNHNRFKNGKGVFRGIFLTGWSRYTHFSELCELLPTSTHSLILNLMLINECRNVEIYSELEDFEAFNGYIITKLREELNCSFYIIYPQEFDSAHCTYDDSKVYYLLRNYLIQEAMLNHRCGINVLNTAYETKKYSNKTIVHISKRLFDDCVKNLTYIATDLNLSLKEYFVDSVVNEYIAQITRYSKSLIEQFKYLN